ncbi:MAG TPA: site-specific integrase [Tepidisphaeraceae bacterium]|nr:site-specific integrase [Tepidisphaeraceae bacterium]
MAALQFRNGVYRLIFWHNQRQHSLNIGRIPESEAETWKGRAEHLLMRVEQRLLEIPAGVSIADFVRYDGKPPADPELEQHRDTTLHQLREAYLATFNGGAIESNTLRTMTIHLDHIERTLGRGFILSALTLAKLQGHVTGRAKDVSAVTIKKEIDTFRAVWNWGERMKFVQGVFPCRGLVYPKTDEKLPFMTWAEIERRIKAGGDADTLWECLYLDARQVAAMLEHVKAKELPNWIYPMMVMAAHTGARKSELIRARVEDVDLDAGIVTLREKKRSRGTRTTRQVPISSLLADALSPLIQQQQGKAYLFGDGDTPLTVQTTHNAIERAFRDSKWAVIKGWHTLRHSFISVMASKKVDQRIIDDCVGHSTEEQRRRYRHLFPAIKRKAIAGVFG